MTSRPTPLAPVAAHPILGDCEGGDDARSSDLAAGTALSHWRNRLAWVASQGGFGMAAHAAAGRTVLLWFVAAVALAACDATRPVDWAPDGSHLAVAYGGQLYFVAADRSGVTRVTNGSVISDGPGDADVTWSPAGHQVAFTRGDDVWIADIANGAERRLAAGTHPAWSPDGRWIAFTVGGTSGQDSVADIWTVDPGGTSAPRHLGRAAAEGGDGVDWAGDGMRVAVCSNEGLVVFGIADGSRRDVTAGACAGSPSAAVRPSFASVRAWSSPGSGSIVSPWPSSNRHATRFGGVGGWRGGSGGPASGLRRFPAGA